MELLSLKQGVEFGDHGWLGLALTHKGHTQ
jgi:hypothetical protein